MFEFNNIVSLTEFPGMSPNVFIEHVEKGGTKGFILRASGTGDPNVSDDESQTLRVAFEYLREKKIPIIITTQTHEGSASMSSNKPGTLARKLGAIPAYDMSIEAITVKLGMVAWTKFII